MLSIDSAPTDGTPFLAYCPKGIERPGWQKPPGMAQFFAIVWNGHPNEEQPRGARWVAADVQVDTFTGSEYTGSWNEYEFTPVEPTHWMPLPTSLRS
jgi:hypothetical protein